MNEATLPPSPNWYLGNILACAKDGSVAWGARNAIVIVTPGQDNKIFQYSIIQDAHLDRVVSLAFSPEFGDENQRLLVSGGDENIVRIWNLDSMSAVMACSYLDIKQKVIGVDWSRANPKIVCCVSNDGTLVVWDVSHNVERKISLGKLTATCLSCCPHNADIVAIGTKGGLVYIVNVHGNGKIDYKLRGHDAEISSLSWCPVESNTLTGDNTKDLLLASGAKDRSIFIWKAGGDGRYQTELTLPNCPLDSNQHRSKLGTAMGGWTAVCWLAPKVLLTSSSWGELLSWDLTSSSKTKPAYKLIHACHSRGLFCIAKVEGETAAVDSNWRSDDARNATVWTLAQDRRVVRCNVKAATSEITYNVPTQGGYTYCIAASPLDTSRVAFGVGDAMIRLWNLCEPHENTFDITMLWQKIKGKVMAVSWHPEKENLLAFGTGEGRVGVFDTNTSKPPILYRQYHRHAVYTLGWGPEPNGKSGYVLYSCGDGELVYYTADKPFQAPKSVIKKDCTEFSWKPDNSCLAIGFENGSISFLSRDLKECGQSIHLLKKAVQCLAWHPESTSTDPDLSPLRHQLAVSTNAHEIIVLDLTELSKGHNLTDAGTTAVEGVTLQKVVGTLNGHTAKVVDLSWSPHISGYLASASYDGTVQIWKTESQELVGTYTSHCGPVHCCMWSPLDPNLIISGSADFTVRIWKLSDQEVRRPPENPSKPKKVRTKRKKHRVEGTVADRVSDSEDKILNGQGDDAAKVSPVVWATTEQGIKESLAMDQIRRRKNKKQTYFPVTAKATNDKEYFLNSVMDLVGGSCQTATEDQSLAGATEDRSLATANLNADGSNSNGMNTSEESPALSIFGSKEEILKLLDTEKSSHARQSQHDTVVEMDLWCNNLKENLQEAAKGKRLNDFLVSLAPSLSIRVWQETCETYAAQLEFEGNHRKAVSYLLCIHKVHQAIEVFVHGKMFREAYVLAKCKLDARDPLVDTLLERWAVAAAKEGNFEDAVRCYIKLGNYREAAILLSKRKDSRSLEVAARLAYKADDEEFSQLLAEQAVTAALLRADYDSAENIIRTFPQMQHCEVKVASLREINRKLKGCDDQKIWDWLEGNSEDCMLENLSNRYPNCSHHYAKLLKSSETLQAPRDESTLWIEVAGQIALATACPVVEKKIYHLVIALDAVSRYEMTTCAHESQTDKEVDRKQKNLLVKFLSELDKEGPRSGDSLFIDKEPSIRKSLRAYLCYGILTWLIESDISHTELEGRQELVISLIENLIGDALDKQTVRFTGIAAEVHKLEGSLAIAMGKSNNIGETNGGDGQEDSKTLMEQLAKIRSDKERFLVDRLHAPNPDLVYSKAGELISVLFHGETGEKMTRLLSDTWMKARM